MDCGRYTANIPKIKQTLTMSNAEAEEFKAKGNAALEAGKMTEAIENYTKAINADGTNHVYYSNRSAAFLKKGDANNALEDANSTIAINPGFSKGYSRKGAALHALKRYNDAIAAFEEGLSKFPNDAALKSGLESAKRDKDGPPRAAFSGAGGGMPPGMNNLFGDQLIQRIMLNPKTRPYLSDKEFMAKIQMLQKDPNSLTQMLSDPRIMEVLGLVLGGDDGEEDEETPTVPTPKPKTEAKKQQPAAPKEEEPEEDLSQLSPAERKKKEDQKAAVAAKVKGNDLYKSKKFDEALAAYDEAIALDPTNMTFLNNKAAVFFTSKQYDECIAACLEAVEVGKANRAPYEDRAKAYTRAAKAYQKKGDLAKAIEMCKEAQLESYDKATERMMKNMELEKKKADAAAYHDDDKAEEAKQRGNEHFRNKNWPEAVKEYEEAVKRAPTNAPIRNNLAAALCKIMDFNGATTHIQKAIELDPKYVKAWARKGDIEVLMKENHKALESYKTGLELDSTNTACKEGLRKVTAMINYGASQMTEEEKMERARHGMADPEIQHILQDPIIQQILRDFNENPQAANQAMADPTVRAKIEKLIASGVVQTA
jgi:stress-induced-phosphoprotein 1